MCVRIHWHGDCRDNPKEAKEGRDGQEAVEEEWVRDSQGRILIYLRAWSRYTEFLYLTCVRLPRVSQSPSSLPSPASSFAQMSNKRSNSFRRAILQGSRQLRGCSLRDEVGLGLSQRLVRHVAYETLPREVDRKWYFDSYTYCPPPWLILTITIAEVTQAWTSKKVRDRCVLIVHASLLLSQVVVFMYYGLQLDRLVLQVSSPSFLRSPLPYHPQLRAQAWRYLSYIFMHTGWVQLAAFAPGKYLGGANIRLFL